ncbi:MAG: SpoVG family protein, partial [Planctomycetota bacterium]
MEISDVRVKLMDNAADRLKAVCSVTFDEEFVVRDLKVVDGTNGLFVAMPSRKLAVHCPQCRHKNHLRARFCNDCGAKLPPNRVSADANGRVRLHRDIAHPINPVFRELVQTKIIERYTAERELAGQPGYQPTDLDAEHDEI